MTRIPFPSGLEGIENLPRTRKTLINCWNNQKGQIIPRPGITELNTTNLLARGQFVWDGALYQIVGTDLIKITDTDTGAFSVIDTIAGTENVRTAIGFNTATLVVEGGNLYTLDKSDTLVNISGNANIVPSVDLAHINGRFVYIPADGSPAFFSDVGAAGTVQATSFFDAEELPDLNNSVFNLRNTLYIGGTDSFELYRNVSTSQVFQRIEGARLDYGFIGGLLEYADTFLFVGREKAQDFGIYAIGPGKATKISNEPIDLALTTYTQDELESATAARFKWRGDDIALFTFPNDSFGFFNGEWFELKSFFGLTDVPFAATFIDQFEGTYYTAFDDKIGKLDKVNTDYGAAITRTIDFGFEQEDGDWFGAQSAVLGISQGFNIDLNLVPDIFAVDDIFALDDIFGTPSPNPTVGLSMSRNNVLYGPTVFREVGELGQYTKKLEWNFAGGLGRYEGFMGMRIETDQDTEFAEDYLVVNFG